MNMEMEEGEIVDELDDLSDISSEEENLLRQRLEVLENYNNVLERKNAKRSHKTGPVHTTLKDISDISDTESNFTPKINEKIRISQNHIWKNKLKVTYSAAKPLHITKRVIRNNAKRKQLLNSNIANHRLKYKIERNKNVMARKKNENSKSHSESSDEANNDFKDKKAMLANAVTIQNDRLDKVSLKARLMKMFPNCTENLKNIPDQKQKNRLTNNFNLNNCGPKLNKRKCNYITDELIDLSVDVDEDVKSKTDEFNENITAVPDIETIKENEEKQTYNEITVDSDEDLNQLRQFALQSKSEKNESVPVIINMQSEDEDSDTKELRLICLKSALLKNAIDVKRKERIKKRLSQSCDLAMETGFSIDDSNNNTDIESVAMDTDSDSNENDKIGNILTNDRFLDNLQDHVNMNRINLGNKNAEAEEDEDLLRAKLLTSLSKKLPKLTTDEASIANKSTNNYEKKQNVPHIKESPLIINPNDSDSGSETEAAKNLTKMHNKLIPSDFQKQLDLFLKSTRMEVEKNLLQKEPKLPEKESTPKFYAKPLNHLPKSEQIEYKFLVKRMAELEKLKKARLQYTNNLKNTFSSNTMKDTLKPRNISYDNMVPINLENNIMLSRKKIAEESARMLKLKEEATNLIQKHKIVATELRNLTTAIALNKKQTRIAQVKLTNCRNQHQLLLKRSRIASALNKQKAVPSTQKENACYKPNSHSSIDLKKVKVSIVNEIRPEAKVDRITEGVNKKVLVKDENLSSNAVKGKIINNQKLEINNDNVCPNEKPPETKIHIILQQNDILPAHRDSRHPSTNVGDYVSPLQSITSGACGSSTGGGRRALW